jgi:hypothetical protein
MEAISVSGVSGSTVITSPRHHVARAAAELAQVAFRRFLRRRQQAQPPGGAAARVGFGAMDQVTFADDADQACRRRQSPESR